jgi:hypothetical protein
VSRNVTFVVDNDDARLGRAIYFEYRNESMRVNAFRPTKWARSSCSRTRLCPTKWSNLVHQATNSRAFVRRNEVMVTRRTWFEGFCPAK